MDCTAQQSSTVDYKIQFKGEKFDYLLPAIPENRIFTFFDSTKLKYLAENYIESIFNTNDSLFLTDNLEVNSVDAGTPVYSIISNGTNNLSVAGKISVTDSVIYIDESPYLNRQGMSGYNYDTVYVVDPETGGEMAKPMLSYDIDTKNQLCGFCFSEIWDYNKADNTFLKKIKAVVPYFVYYKNYGEEDYAEAEPVFRRINIYRKQRTDNASELIFKDMIYDVMVIPESNVEDRQSYDYYSGKPEPEFCNRFVIDLLADVKSGKIKAYPIATETANGAGKINFQRQLSYKEVVDSLSYSTQRTIGADTAKLREFKKYTVNPVINTNIKYKMNEYGEYEYDDYGNMIELSKEDEIVGYDTIWPSPGKYRKEVSKIYTDTVIKYKMDENGEYIMNGNWETIPEDTTISTDTTYNEIFLGLNEHEFFYTDTIFHNKLENIHSYRFYEDWYFDKESFAIRKKVNGIAFHTGVKRYDRIEKTYDLYTTCKVYFKLN